MDAGTRDVLLTLITVSGTVVSAVFASRSKRHAGRASVAADAAVEASLKPPRMPTRFGTNPRINFVEIEEEDFGMPEGAREDESPVTPRDMSVDIQRKGKP